MASGDLPAVWEAMSHTTRVRAAIEVGRRSRSDAGDARLLRRLASGGFTARLMATYACHGSRDSAALLARTADPSRSIAALAMSVLCDVGNDDSLFEALCSLPPRRAARALFWLRRPRPGVVDRFVDARAAEGDGNIWPLVPLGSPAVLDRHFTLAAERGGDTFWRRLAALHPARAAAEVDARLAAAAGPDGLLIAAARTVLAVLSDRHPDVALGVVAALRRHAALDTISMQTLAMRRPAAVADLVLGASESASVQFERVAHRLAVPRIVGLFRRDASHLGDPEVWLGRLPAADRAAVYHELAPAWTGADGVVDVGILRRLPAPIRYDEARRVAALPALATRPLQRLAYVGLLPWDEARAGVQSCLVHPDAEHRAAALGALGDAARFDRTRLGDLLDLLMARKHEQDPVRLAALDALAALPPGRWEAGHLPALAQVVRDALDAGDLSPGSVRVLGRFILSLLPFHPAWAAEQLAAVTRERGYPEWSGRSLTAKEVRQVAPVLTPIVASWLNREDEDRVVSLADNIGRWLPDWPELVGFLERLIRTGRDSTAAAAMAQIAEHARADRERIIVAALAQDESWAVKFSVMNFLHLRRQDLLTPFLGQRAYAGRFSTGWVRHVLPLDSGFFRWTDAQQEMFASTLAELAESPLDRNDVQLASSVLGAIRRLPALPAVGPDRLVRLANDERPAVRETAVRALGRLDDRQGTPELLEALGDDRARWAIYSLRQALNDLAPARVLAVMREVPLGKVTVAKETVRLAGELGGPEALGWFGELHRRDLHRDVRGALLRALWDHLDRPEAWAILDESVDSPDPGVVIGLARIQVGRASDAARARVAGLFRRLLDHPEPTVRVAVLTRLKGEPVPDPSRGLLATLLAKLDGAIPDERAGGLAAALAGATDADASTFGGAFARLLPRRRELAEAVVQFAAATRTLGPRLLEVRSAVLEALAGDPATTTLQARLAATRLAAEEYARWVGRLAGTGRWHVATQVAAIDALREAGRPAEDVERAEVVWAASPDPAIRWLALRALIRAASTQGWTPDRRERLRLYRQDPSPLVGDEAAFTFPPEPEATTPSP